MIKTVVVSALLLTCFLVMSNLIPCLLQNTRPSTNNKPPKQNNDQIIKSIVLLVGIAIILTLILHFWH